jgi:hypothetical protein
MFRISSLRYVAALFVFCGSAVTAVPAFAAGEAAAPAAGPTTATYAAVLQTINPKLPLAKAQAYARSVMADAWRTHLDPRFIMSIVTVESRWRANAVSHSGARGLGQLMPATAATLGVNAWNAADNLRGTSAYLKTLMNRFAGKPNATTLAIAGYNAGPRAVERFGGIPPYAETQHYVVKVLRVWKQLNGRVGRAFAAAPATSVAVDAAPPLPDVQQWLTNVNTVLPATAAAVETLPNPVLTSGGYAASAAVAPVPAEPSK